MEMFSAGKDESTLSQVTYSSVKEDAREDMIGYREVEPQNRMDDWNLSSASAASVLSAASAAVVSSAFVSAAVVSVFAELPHPVIAPIIIAAASNTASFFFIIQNPPKIFLSFSRFTGCNVYYTSGGFWKPIVFINNRNSFITFSNNNLRE